MTSLTGLAQALFAPATIALVGASADERKHAARPQQHLARHGFAGRVFPVNPHRREIFGERAYPTVAAIGEPVDHAFILLPSAAVEAAVDDCVAAGVRCITILAGGFAESGSAGRARQRAVVDNARRGGARILGPNSLGVVNPADAVALSANEALALPALPRGRLGLVTQSGSLLGSLVSRAATRGIGFSRIASVGNEADLGVGEIADMLVDDPDTGVVLLFVETIRDADRIAAMARRAADAGKPVVCFRLGRSAEGARLAASHTGALSGDGAATDAFLDHCGIVRVRLLDTLLNLPALLAGRRPPAGARVAVMSTTGGGGGLLVDALSDHDVTLAPPEPALVEQLQGQGIAAGASPLIDLTLAGTNAATVSATLHTLLRAASCDLVAAVIGSSAQFRPDRAVEPAIAAARACPGKPLAVFIAPQADAALAALQRAGVAAFLTPESCADGIAAYLRWRPARHTDLRPPPQVAAAAALLRGAAGGVLDPSASRALLGALGIPQVSEVLLPADDPSFDDVPESLSAMNFPVVAKIVSPDIAHKTEAGGVVTGIASPADLRRACRDMIATVRDRRADARIAAIAVQPFERGVAEALIGYRRDPQVGPTVMLGSGGVLAEIYRDVAIRVAPIDRDVAREMIREVRGLAVVRGYRGLPPGDVDALADALCAMSWLAHPDFASVREAEANPVLVRAPGRGVVAVDALVARERHDD